MQRRLVQEVLPRTLVMVLAGGEGERLYPLTRDRAKPAVPFGGHYRIIDFTLSNCLNSGLRRIHVLTQYKSLSLHRHLRMGWDVFCREVGEFLDIIPPQQRKSSVFYKGTADAVFQNIYTLEREGPEYVVVLSGDHVYKMDYLDMLQQHLATGADLTVSCVELPRERACGLGVVETGADDRITRFVEKSPRPPAMPERPDHCLTSMGVYVFRTKTLVRRVSEDARRRTAHDFGADVIPRMLKQDRVFAHRFAEPGRLHPAPPGPDGEQPGGETDDSREPYWRDIGTIDAYYDANMDLTSRETLFDLHDQSWPIRTYQEQRPPAKFWSADTDSAAGTVANSIVAAGCVASGGRIERSVLSPGVRVHSGSVIESAILLEDVDVGRGAVVRRAIIDKGVSIPAGERIGVDLDRDRRRFTVSPGGVVVVPKEMRID